VNLQSTSLIIAMAAGRLLARFPFTFTFPAQYAGHFVFESFLPLFGWHARLGYFYAAVSDGWAGQNQLYQGGGRPSWRVLQYRRRF
jgi:hypothetical protein